MRRKTGDNPAPEAGLSVETVDIDEDERAVPRPVIRGALALVGWEK